MMTVLALVIGVGFARANEFLPRFSREVVAVIEKIHEQPEANLEVETRRLTDLLFDLNERARHQSRLRRAARLRRALVAEAKRLTPAAAALSPAERVRLQFFFDDVIARLNQEFRPTSGSEATCDLSDRRFARWTQGAAGSLIALETLVLARDVAAGCALESASTAVLLGLPVLILVLAQKLADLPVDLVSRPTRQCAEILSAPAPAAKRARAWPWG